MLPQAQNSFAYDFKPGLSGWSVFDCEFEECVELRLFDPRVVRDRIKAALCGNRVVFHHVPKCGGTSIYRALRTRYAVSYEYVDIRAIKNAFETIYANADFEEIQENGLKFREAYLIYLMNRDRYCIAGHIPFSTKAYEKFNKEYKFITTIRDPVEFFVSFYFFNLTSQDSRWRIELPISEFLETPDALEVGSFFARFFCGVVPHTGLESDDLTNLAKQNLSRFSLVGLVEDMKDFEVKLRKILDIRLTIGHKNRARVDDSEKHQAITPEIRRKIEEISGPNIEIYEYARSRLGK